MEIMNERCSRVEVYVPVGTDASAVSYGLLELGGGFTIAEGAGAWLDSEDRLVSEDVDVYICLSPTRYNTLLEYIITIGEDFLEDNPAEQCFVAYASGRKITLTR